MIFVVYVVVALVGAGIHLLRQQEDRTPLRVTETVLLWWLVVAIGLAGFVGGLFHLFDGPEVAREIGYTRGDGGFQTEVGFGDVALGVAAFFCIWFRDRYWLAVIVFAAISLWGDAYGHIYQAIENDNDDPDNTGPVLYLDIAAPLIAIVLYSVRERLLRGGDALGSTR